MRYGKEHKTESRARIVSSAAQQIRANGPDKVAVADLMASAGLTHGGFYAHFTSKDALVAEAVDAMFIDAQRQTQAIGDALANPAGDIRVAFRAYLESYLSPRHRDGAERGCPLPSLAADMARGVGAANARFASGLKRLTSRIEAALERLHVAEAGAEANALVAQMVGAVALARAIGTGEQSDAMLRDTLTILVARYGL